MSSLLSSADAAQLKGPSARDFSMIEIRGLCDGSRGSSSCS